MKAPTALPLTLSLLSPVLFAGELTIGRKPFQVEHQFTATTLPSAPANLALEPLAWSSYVIETIRPHGSEVKKDEVLIAFKAEPLQRKLEDTKAAVAAQKLALATQELAFAKLADEVAIQLAAAQRAKQVADEELAYFNATGRPAEETSVANQLKRAQFSFDSEKEELKQLQQMYEEDDLTEETEEIILHRQKISVELAEASLKESHRLAKRKLEIRLPREKQSLEEAAKQRSIELEKSAQDLPRSLETAKIELETARRALAREVTELGRLEKDAALLKLTAPGDGVFYHGVFKDGAWKLGDLAKYLVKGGTVPLRRGLVSVVGNEAPAELGARIDPAIARPLTKGTKTHVSFAGLEGLPLIAEVAVVEQVPAIDGKHLVTLNVTWPEDFKPVAGAAADCHCVVYEKKDALALPQNALQAHADGSWTVEVKLAAGSSEARTVVPGRRSDKQVEILSGLEAGQVVVVPD